MYGRGGRHDITVTFEVAALRCVRCKGHCYNLHLLQADCCTTFGTAVLTTAVVFDTPGQC